MNKRFRTSHQAGLSAAANCFRRVGRPGFTVIEVLVSIGVVSILAAILLPAVQSSRESARRTECVSHLRQLMFATESFHSVHGQYPLSRVWDPVPGPPRIVSASPHRELLPYLDQQAAFNLLDRNELGVNHGYAKPFVIRPANEPLLKLTVPVFLCPSDGLQFPGTVNYRANHGYGPGFLGPPVIPPTGCYDPGNVAGAFHAQRAMRPRDFHDGLSSTAFYSERVLGDHDPDVYDPWRDYVRFVGNGLGMDVCTPDQMIADCRDGIAPGAPHASYVGVTWLFGGWVQTAYNHILTPNSPIPDCAYDSEQFPNGGHAAMTARSHHPGGVNVVFGDAHVEFVSQQVDLGVWREMSTRAGTLPGSTF